MNKLLFLLSRETASGGGSAFYQFVPYKYGPYSFSLTYELGQLLRDGLIVQLDAISWKLSESGNNEAFHAVPVVERDIAKIFSKYCWLSQSELLDIVYLRYPEYTILSDSEIRRRQNRPKAPPAVYTIGYEGLQVEGFMDILLRTGIQRILDVRNNPVSRRYGFHKSTLSSIANKLGISYLHFPSLGIESADRSDLVSIADRNALFEEYTKTTLSENKQLLREIAELLREKPSVLMCMEADYTMCHRNPMAKALAPIADLPIHHLGAHNWKPLLQQIEF